MFIVLFRFSVRRGSFIDIFSIGVFMVGFVFVVFMMMVGRILVNIIREF